MNTYLITNNFFRRAGAVKNVPQSNLIQVMPAQPLVLLDLFFNDFFSIYKKYIIGCCSIMSRTGEVYIANLNDCFRFYDGIRKDKDFRRNNKTVILIYNYLKRNNRKLQPISTPITNMVAVVDYTKIYEDKEFVTYLKKPHG